MSRPAALLAAALAAAPGVAPGEPATPDTTPAPLCAASVSLAPERAHPGQQVVFRLRLLVREDVSAVLFEEPPTFPGLRAERLAPEPAPGALLQGGAIYEIRDDARALFADRPGPVAIPSARVLCRAPAPGGETSQRVATPEATLEIDPLPDAGRPAGFEGLVGPLSLRRHLTPESVALGQSLRLAVTLQGAGNLWDAPEPELSAHALGGAEIFPRAADVELDRGTRLVVRRRFVFDLVPRREGTLEIPRIAFAYYDPVAGRYAEASAEPMRVAVGPAARASAAGAEPTDPAPASEPAQAPLARARPAFVVAAATLGLAVLAAAGLRWRRGRLRARRRVGDALQRAEAAHAAGDRDGELAALARALRIALSSHGAAAAAEGPPEAVSRAGLAAAPRAALDLLATLERARFDPTAPPPEPAAVLRSLATLGLR